MKRNTLSTIYTALLDSGYESTDPIMEEIYKELNRDAEAKAAKEEEYATAWGIVRQVMIDTPKPLTALEIFEQVEDDLPAGFSRNKISYGLTHYWQDFVERDSTGKVNTYTLTK
jgi:hypothetical protein